MRIFSFKNKLAAIKPLLKNITNEDISMLKKGEQVFSDCYLLASMEALSNSSFGKNVLKENISKYNIGADADFYCFTFNKVKNKKENYLITPRSVRMNESIALKQRNPILCGIEIAMNRLVHRHFFKKPIVSRSFFPFLFRSFENNKPSNFLEMFTGVKPRILGESGVNLSLKSHKEEALNLLEKMGTTPQDDYSFVAGSGFRHFEFSKAFHCYSVQKVDLNSREIYLKNKRGNYVKKVSFETALEKLKYLTGYFKEDFVNQNILAKEMK